MPLTWLSWLLVSLTSVRESENICEEVLDGFKGLFAHLWRRERVYMLFCEKSASAVLSDEA